MSTIKVDTITDEAGTGAPDFPQGMTGDGSSLTGLATSAQGALASTALQPNGDGSGLTGVGGTTPVLLGTLTPTSGSSATLSSLDLTGYNSLVINYTGLSSDGSAASYLLVNGYRIGRATVNNASDISTGSAVIYLIDGLFHGVYTLDFSSNISSGGVAGISGLSTTSTSITFTLTASSFDAGSIKVYGVA